MENYPYLCGKKHQIVLFELPNFDPVFTLYELKIPYPRTILGQSNLPVGDLTQLLYFTTNGQLMVRMWFIYIFEIKLKFLKKNQQNWGFFDVHFRKKTN